MSATRDRTAWLEGGDARCLAPPPDVKRTWRVVLLGPPGAGKGTQGAMLTHSLGACPLSTGDVFRAAQQHAPPPGSAMAEAQEHMTRGGLVPDAVVLGILRERGRCLHCRGGFMLDGFPRTLPQARALDALLLVEGLKLDAAINYELPAEKLVARLAGRRVCPQCKAVFHADTHPPRAAGKCDHCGAVLVQRADDNVDSIRVRLATYTQETEPLIEYYREQRLLVNVTAEGEPADILARTLNGLVAHEFSR